MTTESLCCSHLHLLCHFPVHSLHCSGLPCTPPHTAAQSALALRAKLQTWGVHHRVWHQCISEKGFKIAFLVVVLNTKRKSRSWGNLCGSVLSCLRRVDRQKHKNPLFSTGCVWAYPVYGSIAQTMLCAIKVFYGFFLAMHCSVPSIAPVPWVRPAMTIENSSGVVEIPEILIIRESPTTFFLYWWNLTWWIFVVWTASVMERNFALSVHLHLGRD